jgi:hypothetical protein
VEYHDLRRVANREWRAEKEYLNLRERQRERESERKMKQVSV